MTEYLSFGYIVGYCGILFGLCVPIPQLIKILKTGKMADVALGTYVFLICCLSCYLIHAIHIKSLVFTIAQSINLITNSTILVLLIRHKVKGG